MKKTDVITVPVTKESEAREVASSLLEFNGCKAYQILGAESEDKKYRVFVSYDSKHHKKMEELMSDNVKTDTFTIMATSREEALLKAKEQLEFLCLDSPKVLGVTKENDKYYVSVSYNSKQYNKSVNNARRTGEESKDKSGSMLKFKPYL